MFVNMNPFGTLLPYEAFLFISAFIRTILTFSLKHLVVLKEASNFDMGKVEVIKNGIGD